MDNILYKCLNSITFDITEDDKQLLVEKIHDILELGYTPDSKELLCAIKYVEIIGETCLSNIFMASNTSDKILGEHKLIYLLNNCLANKDLTELFMETIFVVIYKDQAQLNLVSKEKMTIESYANNIKSGKLYAFLAIFKFNIWNKHRYHKNCIDYILEDKNICNDFINTLNKNLPFEDLDKNRVEMIEKFEKVRNPIIKKKVSKQFFDEDDEEDEIKSVESLKIEIESPKKTPITSPIRTNTIISEKSIKDISSLTKPSDKNYIVIIEKNSGNVLMLNQFYGKEYKYKFYNALELLSNMDRRVIEGNVYYSLKTSDGEIVYVNEKDFNISLAFIIEPSSEINTVDGKYKIYKMANK